MQSSITVDELRSLTLFSGLSDEDIQCSIVGEVLQLDTGDHLFHEGDAAKHFFIILEGQIEAYRVVRGQRLVITLFGAGSTGGEVPLLSGTPHLAHGMARKPSRVFIIPEARFWMMMGQCEVVRGRVLGDMAERMKQLQLMSYQREKLASLGTLAAGLAHELNNPAAAAKRAAQMLSETLDRFDEHSSQILERFIFKAPELDGYPFQEVVETRRIGGLEIDAMARSEREEELALWLEDQGLDDPWAAAATMVGAGFTQDFLASFSAKLVPDQVRNFLQWMQSELDLHEQAFNLRQSTERISELIAALKSYTYMDQVHEKSEVDLHTGIDNTLTILGFKLRRKKIEVLRDYGEMPVIRALGSELNQVWTNLIDNAIDALPETGGRLEVLTRYRPDEAGREVEIILRDNGAGIAPEVLPRIFDPFFTTKGQGQGTGLGLEICYRIIVNQHHGLLDVQSRPGCTEFRVQIPRG